MNKNLNIAIIFLGSFIGGIVAQPAVGMLHRGYAQAVVWLNLTGSITGTPSTYACSAGANCYDVNRISVTDTMSVGSSANEVSAFGVAHLFGGAGMTGPAVGISSNLTQYATTGNSNVDYVGILNIASANAPDSASSLFGGNDNVFLGNGATGWNQLVGREVDVALMTGSSANDKLGIQVVQTSTDNVMASRENIGLNFNTQPGASTTYDCMVCAGNYVGFWPLGATSTIIGAWPHVGARNGSGGAVPTANAGTTLFGLDWSNVTFAAGGAPIVMPLITPASSATTCRAGSTEWDASFIYICTATNTWKRATLASF